MNGNQLNALIERLQVHDHPKLLEYIMPNKEQNMTTTGEKQVQHHCNVLLRNILRMQGYNLSYVHQVIENHQGHAQLVQYQESTLRIHAPRS